jgi:hypothetical protein
METGDLDKAEIKPKDNGKRTKEVHHDQQGDFFFYAVND